MGWLPCDLLYHRRIRPVLLVECAYSEAAAFRLRPRGVDESDWDGPAYPFHPTPGGLVAWGQNFVGDACFWLAEDPDPDRWPVLMWARGPVTTYRFDGGIVAFLLALLNGDHPASVLLEGPGVHWVMHNDWLRRGLAVSAGPSA